MAKISIFAKPATLAKPDKHLLRGSSIIRGEQIATRLGAKLNPEKGYEDDICIYVKPYSRSLLSGEMKLEKNSYIDIIDGDDLIAGAVQHPNLGVIVCSQVDYKKLAGFLKNKVVLIPQHHCNFEEVQRDRKEVTTIGVIGAPGLLIRLPENLKKRLSDNNFELITNNTFRTRQHVVDFYKSIDIQLVWRPWARRLSNPLKIINAASFGIPTIAYNEEAFLEVEGCFIPIHSVDEIITQANLLRNSPEVYDSYRKQCLDKSREYHIDKIVSIYSGLEG